MAITAGRILKSNEVKIEGRFRLNTDQAGRCLPQQGNTISASPDVRILEQHPEYAVIEITCVCGGKTCVKCEYT